MFESMATISSAGTSLLIPDCEFSHAKTVDVFYMKQVFFTFAIPMIFALSFIVWCLMYSLCHKRWNLTWMDNKDRLILTIDLMIFLCYPMLVRICLSMLKCVRVGAEMYLMADLEEPCFTGRHQMITFAFTIPQMIILITLPMVVFILLHRNKQRLNQPHFRIRYGLLYKGYTKDREWWEITVGFRKVVAVGIGTLIVGNSEVQVGCALFLGLISIVMHLVGQPFGSPNGTSSRLHFMELYSLVVIWCTNWCGLMLFVGNGDVSGEIFLSIFIITMVIVYVASAIYYFVKTFVNTALQRRRESQTVVLGNGSDASVAAALSDLPVSQVTSTKVMPMGSVNQEQAEDSDSETNKGMFQAWS